MADSLLRPPTTPTATRPGLNAPRPTSSRLPPPTLFQGPPSHNASRISLTHPNSSPTTLGSSPPSATNPPPTIKTTYQQQPRPQNIPPASSFSGPALSIGRPRDAPPRIASASSTGSAGIGGNGGLLLSPKLPLTANTPDDTARADALWAEMQNTLAEVELSTMSTNASHVFGESHSKALEGLRVAQLQLRDAWARSEAEEMTGSEVDGTSRIALDETDGGGAEHQDREEKAEVGTLGATGPTLPAVPTNMGAGLDGAEHAGKGKQSSIRKASKTLEEETERDILLARRRREANDRYFNQVNRGVLDVVRRLEDVAASMRKVEAESRDIWNERDTTTTEDEDEEDAGEDGDGDEQAGATDGEDVDRGQGRRSAGTTGSGSDSPLTTSPESVRK